jgi:hypothetical protein
LKAPVIRRGDFYSFYHNNKDLSCQDIRALWESPGRYPIFVAAVNRDGIIAAKNRARLAQEES